MEIPDFGKVRLIVPTDFAKVKGTVDNLMPPSHFTSLQSGGAQSSVGMKMPAAQTKLSLPSLPTTDHNSYWLTISQTQQEILDLKKENQRLMMQQVENISKRNSMMDYRARSVESEQWVSEWRLEAEKYKAEAERLKGRVQTLKEAAVSHRDEMRDKDIALNRQAHELETMHEVLQKTTAELGLVKEELSRSNAQKEKISSQFDNLHRKSSEEIEKLNEDLGRSSEEVKSLSVKVEQCRRQAEEASKRQTQRLSKQLEDLQKNQEIELQKLMSSHSTEVQEALRVNSGLQRQLESMTSEVLHLKDSVTQVSAERDVLKEHLSQMRQSFEAQSTTLQSLRNYIGQLTPESGEKKQLNEAVERLNKEKAVLQTTAELLTVRLNSVNEILALQEQKIIKKNPTHSIGNDGSEYVGVLQLWREKVFKLCVQLRTKDIELKAEKHKLLSQVKSVERQLQQEQHKISVLHHTLDDKAAALDLERVEKETIKQELVKERREHFHLKLQIEKDQKDLKNLSEVVQSLCLMFNTKLSEMDAAQTKVNACVQRVTFAKRRVETIQGLILRRAALQKVQQSSNQTEKDADSIRNLQTELRLVSEERDKLTLELKRTPGLIEKALSDLKEQYETRLVQKQQKLEQSVLDVQDAMTVRDQAKRSLELIQDQLQQTEVKVEHLSNELLSQQENSQKALEERVSEIQERYSAKLKEMEDEVNRARAEHTRAVMTLRHFERQAAKKKECLQKEDTHIKPRVPENSPRHHTGVQQHAVLSEQRESTSQHLTEGPKVQLPADVRLLSVLKELQSLSAVVVNSSEESAEEEEEGRATTT